MAHAVDAGREGLALRVVELARADALAQAGFLAPAIGRLGLRCAGLETPLATDGRVLAVDAERVLEAFAQTGVPPTHDVLHVALHCVLQHPFVPPAGERDAWWLACDVVVEALALHLLGPRDGARGQAIGQAVRAASAGCGDVAEARRVRRWMERAGAADEEAWPSLFRVDDHACWTGGLPMAGEAAGQEGDPLAADAQEAQEGSASGVSVGREVELAGDPAEDWQRIARELKASLQAIPRDWGSRAGMLVQAVEASLREKVDYAAWLRRFAVPGETMRLSDDGFDLVFYTYGLRRYGNLPLVEPLEQREERRIREFVIVIDTSQSVSGEAVTRFVDETYQVLREGEAFFERVHVRIIQCDAEVQSDTVITDLRELEDWARQVELRGFGGTDFRPAFRYVDKLVEDGAFENLGGLVYFTDGWGVYPEWRPRYQVAFAFYDEDHRTEEVPPWAVQVTLAHEEGRR